MKGLFHCADVCPRAFAGGGSQALKDIVVVVVAVAVAVVAVVVVVAAVVVVVVVAVVVLHEGEEYVLHSSCNLLPQSILVCQLLNPISNFNAYQL